ncbi:MAG: hypothetical protein WAN93_11845 [Solirubrobacteraceae bacterium]
MRTLIRLLAAALLGVAAAVLVSCGSSGSGLIPTANAGPLQSDFEAVAQAAASGDGDCAATESALGKTEQDFLALPDTIDGALHARLEEGVSNLRKRALAMCIQTTSTATSTTSTETTPTTTTTTSTETTPTTTTSTTPTTPTSPQTTPTSTTPPSQSGGTEASGESPSERGAGVPQEGAGDGGSNAGGANPGDGQ